MEVNASKELLNLLFSKLYYDELQNDIRLCNYVELCQDGLMEKMEIDVPIISSDVTSEISECVLACFAKFDIVAIFFKDKFEFCGMNCVSRIVFRRLNKNVFVGIVYVSELEQFVRMIFTEVDLKNVIYAEKKKSRNLYVESYKFHLENLEKKDSKSVLLDDVNNNKSNILKLTLDSEEKETIETILTSLQFLEERICSLIQRKEDVLCIIDNYYNALKNMDLVAK